MPISLCLHYNPRVMSRLIERFRNWRTARARRTTIENARIDPHDKCPACGWRRGKIRFDSTLRVVVHSCQICKATWGETTVVEVSAWVK